MRKWVLISFSAVGAVAEAVQLVALMWTTLHLTGSASLVGVVNAFAFLPGVVAGVALRQAFDRGSAITSLSRTNWVCVGCSLVLAGAVALELNAWVLIGLFCTSQAALSVAKLANKSALARALRQMFDRQNLPPVQGRISSTTIIGGVVGSGLAGLLLAFVGVAWCFTAASVLYALSVLLIGALRRYGSEPTDGQAMDERRRISSRGDCKDAGSPEGTTNTATLEPPAATTEGRRILALVLLVSIPSSGALQYLTALLPTYADHLVPGSAPYYSALDVAAMAGGILAGSVIGFSRMRKVVQLYALAMSGVLCLVLVPNDSPVVAAGLVALVSLTITAHVVGMQIATNQLAPDGQVGRYMAVRNSGVGLAKAVFSVSAGFIAQASGVTAAWTVLACFLVLVAAVFSLSPQWRRFASA